MKTSNRSPRRRRAARTDAAQRAQILADFDRSGLSAAAFARRRGLHYTTLCGWRQRRDKSTVSPAFMQVELPEPAAAVELVIEPGARARLRLTCRGRFVVLAHSTRAYAALRSVNT